jgi:hypothetical protein
MVKESTEHLAKAIKAGRQEGLTVTSKLWRRNLMNTKQ